MLGCIVKAKYGPFQDLLEHRRRRERHFIHGVVIQSRTDQKWLIYWADIDRTCEHLRAGLTYAGPKDPALTEKAMDKLNEDTVELDSCAELKRFVSVTMKATNILNGKNDNARKLIAAAAAARTEFNRVTNELAIPPPTRATADAATALISLASVGTGNLNIEIPLLPSNTVNFDGQEPDAATALISLSSNRANIMNMELPPVTGNINVHEKEYEQDPEFVLADVYDPDIIREEVMNMPQDRHVLLQTLYKREKDALIDSGLIVKVGKANAITQWKVRGDVQRDSLRPNKEYHHQIGIKGFNFGNKPVIADGKNYRINFLHLLQHLWPGCWKSQLQKMNTSIETANRNNIQNSTKYRSSYRKIHAVSANEFWQFSGILLLARLEGVQGSSLWKQNGKSEGYKKGVDVENSIMTLHRFKDMKLFMPYLWENATIKETDQWWKISKLFADFNENRVQTILSSNTKTVDETMSAFRPRTTKHGNLPHLSFIQRKPEDLGTEMKTIACTVTKIMLGIELCRAKEDPNGLEFFDVLRKKTSACTVRLMKGVCQRNQAQGSSDLHAPSRFRPETNDNIHQSETLINDDATDDCLLGDSWFGSVTTAIALRNLLPEKKSSITQIKTAHSRFPKKYLEETTKGWPGGSYLVLESTIEGVKLFAVGYKYNQRKCLCFLFNEGASSTEEGTPYIARWVDENGNARQRHVVRPECCSTYFKYSNVIDVLNQQRQKELRLEKFWVTNDGYFRLFTTVLGIGIVDVWNGYRHHLGEKHRHKNCNLMDLVNMITKDLLENEESKVIVINDEALSIGIVSEINLPNSSSLSEDGISQLTSPSFSDTSNQLRIELAMNEHTMIQSNDKSACTKVVGRSRTGNRQYRRGTRRKRNRCRECILSDGETGPVKTSQYCSGCVPPVGCNQFWVCNNCVSNHNKRIRKDLENTV